MPSQGFVEASIADATGEVYLVLLTIEHADLAAPFRLVNNTVAIRSNGQDYEPFPFAFLPPEESEDGVPRATLEIDNVDQRIAAALRKLTSAPTATAQVILASDPDTIERDFPAFRVSSASWDVATVQGTLSARDDSGEPACAWRYTPAQAPGLF